MLKLLTMFMLLVFSFGTFAQEPQCVPANAQTNKLPEPYNTQEMTDKSFEAIKSFCNYIENPTSENYEFARQDNLSVIALLKELQPDSLDPVSKKLDVFLNRLTNNGQSLLPVTPLVKAGNSKVQFKLAYTEADQATLIDMGINTDFNLQYDQNSPEAIACINDISCYDAVNATNDVLVNIYAPLKFKSINKYRTIDFLNKAWDRYFTEAREQTYLDILATQGLYSLISNESHDFVGPPSYQAFLLRPNIVFEHVAKAVDGDQSSEAFALEVIGINLWQEDGCIFFSCGLSYTLNFSDRFGIKSKGHGLMFHINNSYSIGISQYQTDANDSGDKYGVFVTFDLLKLFQDKKETLKRFRN